MEVAVVHAPWGYARSETSTVLLAWALIIIIVIINNNHYINIVIIIKIINRL